MEFLDLLENYKGGATWGRSLSPTCMESERDRGRTGGGVVLRKKIYQTVPPSPVPS